LSYEDSLDRTLDPDTLLLCIDIRGGRTRTNNPNAKIGYGRRGHLGDYYTSICSYVNETTAAGKDTAAPCYLFNPETQRWDKSCGNMYIPVSNELLPLRGGTGEIFASAVNIYQL
jgi:hypothetical protein